MFHNVAVGSIPTVVVDIASNNELDTSLAKVRILFWFWFGFMCSLLVTIHFALLFCFCWQIGNTVFVRVNSSYILLSAPSVTLGGHSLVSTTSSVGGSQSNFVSYYQLGPDPDPHILDGVLNFTVDFVDAAGNVGVEVTELSSPSVVPPLVIFGGFCVLRFCSRFCMCLPLFCVEFVGLCSSVDVFAMCAGDCAYLFCFVFCLVFVFVLLDSELCFLTVG